MTNEERHDVPQDMLIETDLGDILVTAAQENVHRCTGCVGLTNAPICHFLACKAEWRADNTNVIVVPYKDEENEDE